ncbi:MAG: hypothetical protein Ct9H90mP11_06760 [Acidimicrobiales bacterium]|nr:MAG: hypothetical protein Ct9H90mP11_06760 [Acidimicrobiales bacterium]
MGATNAAQAEAGTIRGDFSALFTENLVMDPIQLNLQNEKSKYSSDKNALNFGGCIALF